MEKDSLRGHFEQLLNERTGEFKMYPTERVWNSIYRRLHTRRKWHFIGGGTFALMILAGVFVLMQDNPRPPSKTFSHTVSAIKPGSRMLATENTSSIHTVPTRSNELNFNAGELQFSSSPLQSTTSGEDIAALNPVHAGTFELPSPELAPIIETHNLFSLQKAQNDPLLTSRLESIRDAEAALSTSPMRVIPSPTRYSWDFHFEPSVSYRTLKSRTTITSASLGFIVVDNNGYDINHLVEQRPSVGFEVGSDVRYALTSRWNLKAGLQFNYSRYTAAAAIVQQHTAITNLSVGSAPPTPVSNTTPYANESGHAGNMGDVTWIPDQRIELSVPVGAEFEILRTGGFSWNVAGTFQPSYILNAKAFLLSSDYQSYVQNPNLLRTWNMNIGAETFLRFNRGDVQIQVGPQFRYQLLPSFISSYPISEHLYDIGFKIGVVRTIR
jgi:hypothetical protein